MQLTIWTPILLVTSLLAFGLAAYVFVRYFWGGYDGDFSIVVSFLGIAIGAGWWSLTYAFHLASTTLSGKLFWLQLTWPGPALLMIAWPVFVIIYTGRDHWIRSWRLGLFFLVPVTVLGVVWGRWKTDLMYVDPAVETIDGMELLTFDTGWFFLLTIGYTFFVNFFAFALLADLIIRGSDRYRLQASVLLGGGMVPTVANILSTTDLIVPAALDLTPVAFVITTPVIMWVLIRYRLLEVAPIARRALFSNLSDGVVVADDEGYIVDMNDVATDMFGEIDGTVATDAFAAYQPVVALLEGDAETVDRQLRVETETGTRLVEVSASTFDRRGTTGTLLLFKDVTDQRELHHRYKALVEKSPNIIMTLADDGSIEYASPSIERLLGFPEDRIHGESLVEFVHPDDRPSVREYLRAEALDEATSFEVRFRHADGTVRRFKTTLRPLAGGLLLVATDITAQHRYKQRLQVLNRVLRHDLKNDVGVISLNAELLQDEVDDPAALELLGPIECKANSLKNLSQVARDIDTVLSEESALTIVDLATAVEEAADRLETSYPAATVTVDTPKEAPVWIDQLYPSLLDNLLENAVEHNDQAEPQIDITVEQTGETVEVAVADNGPGLPEEERELLESEASTPKDATSGLGLWLVTWIVGRSGGNLSCEDNQPRGTIITISFHPEQALDHSDTASSHSSTEITD